MAKPVFIQGVKGRSYNNWFCHLKKVIGQKMFVHSMHLYIDIVSHSQYQYKVLVCTVFIPNISAIDYDEFYLEKKKEPPKWVVLFV